VSLTFCSTEDFETLAELSAFAFRRRCLVYTRVELETLRQVQDVCEKANPRVSVATMMTAVIVKDSFQPLHFSRCRSVLRPCLKTVPGLMDADGALTDSFESSTLLPWDSQWSRIKVAILGERRNLSLVTRLNYAGSGSSQLRTLLKLVPESTELRETKMFGILGTLLLVTWIADYALAFAPGFVKSPLLVLACIFLAADFVWSRVTLGDHLAADATAPPAIVKYPDALAEIRRSEPSYYRSRLPGKTVSSRSPNRLCCDALASGSTSGFLGIAQGLNVVKVSVADVRIEH
jgi:hypothetical protein